MVHPRHDTDNDAGQRVQFGAPRPEGCRERLQTRIARAIEEPRAHAALRKGTRRLQVARWRCGGTLTLGTEQASQAGPALPDKLTEDRPDGALPPQQPLPGRTVAKPEH